MSLIVDERREGGWLVVGVAGDLDIYTAPHLRVDLTQTLAQAAGQRGKGSPGDAPDSDVPVHGLVLDLSAVTFMDSAGLGVLVGAYKRATADHTVFRLAAATEQVTRLFDITGLSQVLAVHRSVLDAVLRSPGS